MALQLTQDNLRQIRYQLYQDQVFLVTHSALRILLCALDLVKLFVLAYKFTDGLLDHLPSEHDLMEYEVEDIFRELNEELVADGKADVADEDVAFDGRLLLMLFDIQTLVLALFQNSCSLSVWNTRGFGGSWANSSSRSISCGTKANSSS